MDTDFGCKKRMAVQDPVTSLRYTDRSLLRWFLTLWMGLRHTVLTPSVLSTIAQMAHMTATCASISRAPLGQQIIN